MPGGEQLSSTHAPCYDIFLPQLRTRNNKNKHPGVKNSKPWIQVNLPSFTLLSLRDLVTETGSWPPHSYSSPTPMDGPWWPSGSDCPATDLHGRPWEKCPDLSKPCFPICIVSVGIKITNGAGEAVWVWTACCASVKTQVWIPRACIKPRLHIYNL